MGFRIGSVIVVCAALASPARAQIARLSISTAGVQANGASGVPSISADGRYVVFASSATNLIAGDANGVSDIFLRDRDTDADAIFDEPGAVATTRIVLGMGGAEPNGPSTEPAISTYGRYVAFVSTATNLVAGANGVSQVYRLDRTTGEIVRVSQNQAGDAGNLASDNPAINANADVVAFRSAATNLAAGQDSSPSHIFVREIEGAVTTRLTPLATGIAIYQHRAPSISSDGRRIAYGGSRIQPSAQELAWVQDRITGLRTVYLEGGAALATIADAGDALVVRNRTAVRRYVVDNYVASLPLAAPSGATTGLAASPSTRYALTESGHLADFQLNVATSLDLVSGGGGFNADERWLTFVSSTSTLLPGNADTNGVDDVFVIDLPARFDQDADTMDDRWETLFGVTDPNGDPDADGIINAAEENAGTHPIGTVKRYFAEGATGSFFATRIALANPDPALSARVVLVFHPGLGTGATLPVILPPRGSAVVDVGSVRAVTNADVSTTIESDRFVVADRTMEWGLFGVDFPHGYGSHAETSTPAPATAWFLAEGSTVVGFDLFYLLQNPQPTFARATIRYLLPSGTVVNRVYDLAPRSRTTVYVNEIPGLDETDVSGDVSADVPIIVERAMYRSTLGQPFALGTASMGVTAPSTRWFLAEGATGSFFDTYVLIANPGNADATVTADYARPDGTVVTQQYLVRAHSRFSAYVDSIAGLENTSVATTVTSTNAVPIVVERAMYWPGGFFEYYEGHTSPGSTTTARTWAIAGAAGGPFAQTFVLIANTENREGQVDIRLLTPNGDNSFGTIPLAPNSRTTVEMPIFPAFGVLVTSIGPSPVELVVESAVYRSIGSLWTAGSNALATPVP